MENCGYIPLFTTMIVLQGILTFVCVQPDEQRRDLWSPLPYQGWKPCLKSSSSYGNNWLIFDSYGRLIQISSLIICFENYSITSGIKWIHPGVSGWWTEPAKNGGKLLITDVIIQRKEINLLSRGFVLSICLILFFRYAMQLRLQRF